MKTTALGKLPKSLSRGEADGGSLAQPYHFPGLRSQASGQFLIADLGSHSKMQITGSWGF